MSDPRPANKFARLTEAERRWASMHDAAPDLYEALREARVALWAIEDSATESGFDKLANIIADRLVKANAAIAKADGEVA